VVDNLRVLKQSEGPRLLTQGSTELVHTLLAADLVDELRILTFPVVLGKGKRLFAEGAPASFKLTSDSVSPSGVVIAAYESLLGGARSRRHPDKHVLAGRHCLLCQSVQFSQPVRPLGIWSGQLKLADEVRLDGGSVVSEERRPVLRDVRDISGGKSGQFLRHFRREYRQHPGVVRAGEDPAEDFGLCIVVVPAEKSPRKLCEVSMRQALLIHGLKAIKRGAICGAFRRFNGVERNARSDR